MNQNSSRLTSIFRHFVKNQQSTFNHRLQNFYLLHTSTNHFCESSSQNPSHRSISSSPVVKNQRKAGSWKWPTTTNKEPRVKTGNRVWYPPVLSDDDARNLVRNLDPTGRKLLMKQLETADDRNMEELYQESEAVPFEQFCKVFLVNCLPFIGFGFLDNGIMIIAGEWIDVQLGVMLGISTMAAAALGNLISDLAGVGTAGYIENLVEKVKVIQPQLKSSQFNYASVRWATSMGRALGIVIGCLLGMVPLLFFEDKCEKKMGKHGKCAD